MSSSFKLYNYNPSSGAAVAFAIFFALSIAGHLWQVYRNKSWFFIPFIIGGLCECVLIFFPEEVIMFSTLIISLDFQLRSSDMQRDTTAQNNPRIGQPCPTLPKSYSSF